MASLPYFTVPKPLMSFDIQYPLFLIPHGGGYLSIVDPQSESEVDGAKTNGEPKPDLPQLLVVCSNREATLRLISQFGLLSAPRELSNDREFSWLLTSVKAPVTHVAFDPNPVEKDLNAAEVVSIEELMSHRLTPDLSPWNYPIFAIAHDEGFASVDFDESDDETVRLIAVFTSRESATRYMNAEQEAAGKTPQNAGAELTSSTESENQGSSQEPVSSNKSNIEPIFQTPTSKSAGVLCKIADVGQARKFLESIDPSFAQAIALDPEVKGDARIAKYCFAIDVLLQKYLVRPSV